MSRACRQETDARPVSDRTIFRSFSSAAAAFSGVVILLFQTAPALAQAIAVDVELVLAVDASASIDRTEIDL
jgi:hypothetical protein